MSLCVCVCAHRTEITPENPLWVGAWWVGFLAGGAAALLIAFPILGYPRQLPGIAPVYCACTNTLYCIRKDVTMLKSIYISIFVINININWHGNSTCPFQFH